MQTNPVDLVEPLHVPTPETPVLREEEVAALLNAYRGLRHTHDAAAGNPAVYVQARAGHAQRR